MGHPGNPSGAASTGLVRRVQVLGSRESLAVFGRAI